MLVVNCHYHERYYTTIFNLGNEFYVRVRTCKQYILWSRKKKMLYLCIFNRTNGIGINKYVSHNYLDSDFYSKKIVEFTIIFNARERPSLHTFEIIIFSQLIVLVLHF